MLWLEQEEPMTRQMMKSAQGSSKSYADWNVAEILTVLVIVLGIVASASGLLLPNLYRDPVGIVPALRGQDLITLLTMPILLVTLFAVRRGSTRAD
jgi:Mg/Co/Ni transporter MgtE